MSLTQTRRVPLDSAAIDTNLLSVLMNHNADGKKVQEPHVGNHHKSVQSPSSLESPNPPHSEPEGITRTEWEEGAEVSSASRDRPGIRLQERGGKKPAEE